MYQKLKAINVEAFKAAIEILNWLCILKPMQLTQQRDRIFSTLIDLHAPLVTEKMSPKPSNP